MKLSKLVFLCVKNVLYLNDSSFNYMSFLRQDFDADPDYDTNINNVFTPLNEAIARLSDLERIPYKLEQVKFESNSKTIDLKNLTQVSEDKVAIKVKEVCGVGQFLNGRPFLLAYKQIGDKVIVIDDLADRSQPVYIEYKEDIPYFDRDNIPAKDPDTQDVRVDTSGNPTPDVDLKEEYGLNDSMCNFVIEYVKGKLEEPIAPDIANMHLTRAEAYFSNIRTVRPVFVQRVVRNYYKIGE